MKEKSLSLAPSIKPYLGNRPAAVRGQMRRVRQAWVTLADRHIAADRLVEPTGDDAPRSPLALEKLNRRAHELHVRRIEKIKQKYGS